MLQDRSLGLKLWSLLSPGTGIGAVGPLGATVDTGGGYWFCHPKYQVGSSPDLNSMSLLLVSDARPLKVLRWYLPGDQSGHRVERGVRGHAHVHRGYVYARARAWAFHLVRGYLPAPQRFRLRTGRRILALERAVPPNWAHRFSNDVPPMELFQAFMAQYRVLGGTVGRKILEAGMYDVVWQTWAKRQADVARGRAQERTGGRICLTHPSCT
jgi:hypothetical protein